MSLRKAFHEMPCIDDLAQRAPCWRTYWPELGCWAHTSRDARVRDARLWLAAGSTNSTVTQPCIHTAVLRAAVG